MEEFNIWSEIEIAERCLATSNYEAAASSALSILKLLRDSAVKEELNSEDNETLAYIAESAALVLVQTYKPTGRTSDIFKDLKELFGFTPLIPYSVFRAGVCLQISEEEYHTAKRALEEFLPEWTFSKDNACYILSVSEATKAFWYQDPGNFQTSKQDYMQLVELYAFNVLAKGLKNNDAAMIWLKNSNILADCGQDIAAKITSLTDSEKQKSTTLPSPLTEHNLFQQNRGIQESVENESLKNSYDTRELKHMDITQDNKLIRRNTITRASKVFESLSFWYPTLVQKLGNYDIMEHGYSKIVWIAVVLIIYLLRRKWTFVKRKLSVGSITVYHVLRDFWNLAFSVQLNPLAAVQPLPSPSYIGR